MEDYVEYLKESLNNLADMYYRKMYIAGEKIHVIFNDYMVDSNIVSNYVIRSLIEIDEEYKKEKIEKENSISKLFKKQSLEEKILNKLDSDKENIEKENILYKIPSKISANKVVDIDYKSEDIFNYIFSGFVLVIFKDKIIGISAKANLYRSISEPTSENSIRGSKDSFTESIVSNVGQIRNRLKTNSLKYKEQLIGRKSKTKTGLIFLEDVAKKEIVEYVEKRISEIDIDGILDVNYIQEYIEEKNESDFPVAINTERPDVVAYYLLQGRVALLVDNSPYVLILPSFFEDSLNNVDDIYQKSKNVTITKIIRYLCMILTLLVPALHLSLITFDQESIPLPLFISFISQRENVPFPAFIESIIMIICFEILKESDLRSNKITGNTMSIVGALILGDAAVSAGIVSPIMIIIVALTTISGLMFTDINVINALRKWRTLFMIFASLAGIIGVATGVLFFVVSLCDTRSYTKAYTYPIAPFNLSKVKKSVITRLSFPKDIFRQKILSSNLVKSTRK